MSLIKFGFSRGKRSANEDYVEDAGEHKKRGRCDSGSGESKAGKCTARFVKLRQYLYFIIFISTYNNNNLRLDANSPRFRGLAFHCQ